MSEHAMEQYTEMRWSTPDGGGLNAGTLRALLDEHVALHPRDERVLWGSCYLREQAPPYAAVYVGDEHVRICWRDADVDAYEAAWSAEKAARDAKEAEQAAAEVSGGAGDPV